MDDSELLKEFEEEMGPLSLKWEKGGRRVYAPLPIVDDNGRGVPTGLPHFVLVENGKARLVCGSAALDLSDFFS